MIFIILLVLLVARLTWLFTNTTKGKVKLVKIDDKTYLCKEFKWFFGREIRWLNPHKSLWSSIKSTLDYEENIFDTFNKNNHLDQNIHSNYSNSFDVDLNDPLPIRVAKYWDGIYDKERKIREKIESEKNNAIQKQLLKKVSTGEVIWESESKNAKTSKTTDILQAAYSDEVLRLTPLIIEAHTNGDSIKENQHLDELEKLMILHGKLKN